jgi:DNA-binding response OmpR family regulator
MSIQQTSSTIRVLLVEDDAAVRGFLAVNLVADGFEVEAVGDHDAALAQLRSSSPDLILVDVNGETLGLLDSARSGETFVGAAAIDTAVIVLTSKVEELHRVRLLERGADDVVGKPFFYPELRARVGAVLRRTAPRQPGRVLEAGPVRIDLRRREVTVSTRVVELAAMEYELLGKLACEPARVFTREELMRDVWGYTGVRTRTLDSHVLPIGRQVVL